MLRKWQNKTETFDILENFALRDPFTRQDTLIYGFLCNPRQIALEGIVKYFPNHPITKDLLTDRLNNDRDEQVRKFARQALQGFI